MDPTPTSSLNCHHIVVQPVKIMPCIIKSANTCCALNIEYKYSFHTSCVFLFFPKDRKSPYQQLCHPLQANRHAISITLHPHDLP